MAPVRYRYVSSRDVSDETELSRPSQGSAVEQYARLMKASEALVKRQQSQNTLIQMLVINRWRDHLERRKKLAWKVLMALRLRALTRSMTPEPKKWEDEAGQLCLVS